MAVDTPSSQAEAKSSEHASKQ